MNAEGIKRLVVDEAMMIREVASPIEKERLNVDMLNPGNTNRCIYGLMTGNCNSDRAIQMLNICTVPFTRSLAKYQFAGGTTFEQARTAFSALEYYIYQPTAKNEVLIDYIKGRIPELDYTML